MQYKIMFIVIVLFSSVFAKAQLSGSLESNSGIYIDDATIKLEPTEAAQRFRSNNYLRLDYKKKKFTAGVQLESYEPKALLNYAPQFKKTNIATYYLNYRNEKLGIDATIGHFYEQFGSGLAFRSWEDRQLGIANSISGAMVKYTPLEAIKITTLYGTQRNGLGFSFSNSHIGGANADIEVSTLFKAKKIKYGVGFSYVNRHENEILSTLINKNTYTTSVRSDLKIVGFSADVEYVFKSKDALVEFNTVKPEFQFDGDAYLLNLSYAKEGFGITGNFRRVENLGLYAERTLAGNIYNQALVNYVPALTKQYDYSLTNIYVYAAQPNISFEANRNKAGEIGGQVDVFFNLKKETALGGKYGTNVSINASYWGGLKGKYDALQRKYAAEGFGFGQKYYSDVSVEIRKKWDKKWSSVITYVTQYYNAKYIEEAVGEVNANTFVFDNTHKLKKSKSLRWEIQHQWAKGRFNNWAAALAEFNFSSSWSVFATDLFNYKNDDVKNRLHFYNVGTTFNKAAYRVQASYGRQRGGLICVGGVCRFVPQSAGFNLGVNISF
jgi:Family of unknown function (DUF6029)